MLNTGGMFKNEILKTHSNNKETFCYIFQIVLQRQTKYIHLYIFKIINCVFKTFIIEFKYT